MIPRARIEEIAEDAVRKAVCAGEPHYIVDAITQALEEARKAVEGEFICPKCGIRHVCKTNNEAPF